LFGIGVHNTLKKAEQLAAAKDGKKHMYAMVSDEVPPCAWEVKSPERVMTQSKSQAVVIKTKNTGNKKCATYLSLRAPGFDLRPPREEQAISLPPKTDGAISWIISPRQTGTYDMTVSDVINTKIFGVTVTNVYGLTAPQAKALSSAASLFGPMLTVPWWLDWWRRRKQNPQPQKNADAKI
jgi:hypothetical protein